MSGDPSRVTVRILEKEYHVACPVEERPALLSSAEYLNRRMREIHLFEKDENHGAREAIARGGSLDSDEIRQLVGAPDVGQHPGQHDIAGVGAGAG